MYINLSEYAKAGIRIRMGSNRIDLEWKEDGNRSDFGIRNSLERNKERVLGAGWRELRAVQVEVVQGGSVCR